ncbi:MAG: hypothetical protein AAFU85_30345, partial [Planctomycetota bacterium]
ILRSNGFMLSRIREQLQIDRPLAFALATRGWQAISGPITIAMLIHGLTLPEQGVYYSLIGIVGIQAFFELGLLNVLVSQTGHEMAALRKIESAETTLQSDASFEHAAARMRDLIRSSMVWFGGASLLFVVCAIGAGLISLGDSEVAWMFPLLALVPIAALTVFFAPAASILEGAGERELVYRFRLAQIIIGSLVVWSTLLAGWKLWSLVASSAVQAIMAGYLTLTSARRFFHRFSRVKQPRSEFSWTHEVLPLQWRVALIGVATHFATQLFTVIVVMFHSDAEGAPLGMTLSATTAIQMLAFAWVQTKYPVVAGHHGAGEREKAGNTWRRTTLVSTCLLLLGFLTLAALVACLSLLPDQIASRFLAPWQVLVLGMGCLAHHLCTCQGFYVLSRRAKPLFVATLVGLLSTGLAVWVGGYLYSTNGVVVGYASAMCLILVPVHTRAYMRFRQRGDAISV